MISQPVFNFLLYSSFSVQVPEGARGDVTDVVGGFCVHASSVCRLSWSPCWTPGKNEQNKVAITTVGARLQSGLTLS